MVAVGAAGMAQGVSDPAIPGTAMNVSGSGTLEVLDNAGNVLEPCHHFLQEISGGVSALFWICAQIAKACIFVDRRILV